MAFRSFKLLVNPVATWRELGAQGRALPGAVLHTLVWALVPALCWYVGITAVGWQVGNEPAVRMTTTSALLVCTLFYLAMIAGVLVLGYLVHWMAVTYDASGSTFTKGLVIVAYTATPFFLAGVLGLYPALWVDILVGVVAAAYCIYLLYIGVPIVMNIAPERGFLYASAVVAVALVGVVAAMTATALLWDVGAEPVYRY